MSANRRLEVHFIDQSVDTCRPERIFFEKALYHVKEKLTTFEDDAYEWLVTSMYGCNSTAKHHYWRTGGFLAGNWRISFKFCATRWLSKCAIYRLLGQIRLQSNETLKFRFGHGSLSPVSRLGPHLLQNIPQRWESPVHPGIELFRHRRGNFVLKSIQSV